MQTFTRQMYSFNSNAVLVMQYEYSISRYIISEESCLKNIKDTAIIYFSLFDIYILFSY